MTKTQYSTATSVDGFIADAEHSLAWLIEVPRNGGSGAEGFRPFFAGVGAMAMGRRRSSGCSRTSASASTR